MRRCFLILMVLAAFAGAPPALSAAADPHDHKSSGSKTLGVDNGLFVGALISWMGASFTARSHRWAPMLLFLLMFGALCLAIAGTGLVLRQSINRDEYKNLYREAYVRGYEKGYGR